MKILLLLAILVSLYSVSMAQPDSSYLSEDESSISQTGTIETADSFKEMNKVKSRNSSMWVAVSLNMITADVLDIYLTKNADKEKFAQDEKVEQMMAAAAVAFQIPFTMVFLSQTLPYKANRITNMIAAPITVVYVLSSIFDFEDPAKPHYYIHATAQIACLTTIFVRSLKWKKDEKNRLVQWKIKNNISFKFNQKNYGLNYTHNFGG